MIPATLKTIFVDGDLDDSSLLFDVQHPYRDKDLLLTNQYDDADDDVHDQVGRPPAGHNHRSFFSLSCAPTRVVVFVDGAPLIRVRVRVALRNEAFNKCYPVKTSHCFRFSPRARGLHSLMRAIVSR